MDAGEITALTTIISGMLAAFGVGDLVPYIGPAINGGFAIVALVTGLLSFWQHRQKTNAMIAAGIKQIH